MLPPFLSKSDAVDDIRIRNHCACACRALHHLPCIVHYAQYIALSSNVLMISVMIKHARLRRVYKEAIVWEALNMISRCSTRVSRSHIRGTLAAAPSKAAACSVLPNQGRSITRSINLFAFGPIYGWCLYPRWSTAARADPITARAYCHQAQHCLAGRRLRIHTCYSS